MNKRNNFTEEQRQEIERKYASILDVLDISDREVAQLFRFANVHSLRTSKGLLTIKADFVAMYEFFKGEVK